MNKQFIKFAVKTKESSWFTKAHPLANFLLIIGNAKIILWIWGVPKLLGFEVEPIDISSIGDGLSIALVSEFFYLVMHVANYEKKKNEYDKKMAVTQVAAVLTYILLIITALVQAIIL
ncbi:MAG: hypothetical protein P1U46_03210 [Patescibacteria group bacterium]|nr:hypothetical protein [Patescibacteria group bacterium]